MSIEEGPLIQKVEDAQKNLSVLRRLIDQLPETRQGPLIEVQKQLAAELDELQLGIEQVRQQRQETLSHVQLLQRITMAASESQSSKAALQFALKQVCVNYGWPIGHVYTLDLNSTERLAPTDVWHLDNPDRFEPFRQITQKTCLTVGEGLPGRVFRTGQASWVTDINQEPNFIRAKAAKRVGLKTALAFPVLINKSVIAILEFFSDQLVEPNEPLLKVMASVGAQLGRVLERERAAQTLQASEEKYRALFTGSSDAILVADPETAHFIDCNQKAEILTGYSKAELQAMHVSQLTSDDWPEDSMDAFNKLRADQELRGEWEILTKSGQKVPVVFSAKRITAGQISYIWGMLQDITERKQQEQALIASQQRLQALFNMSQDAILLTDDQARYVDANPAACELTGYSQEELLQMSVGDLTPAPNRELGQKLWAEFIEAGSLSGEYTLISKNDAPIEIEFRATANILPGLHLSVLRDITERKRQEQALEQYANRLKIMLDIDQAIITAQSSQEIAEGALRHLQKLIPYHRASVMLFDFEAEEMITLALQPENESSLAGQRLPLSLSEINQPLGPGNVWLVTDLQNQTQLSPGLRQIKAAGIRSVINLPFRFQNELYGSLHLGSRETAYFTNKHLEIAREVANALAIAIQQARLFEIAQRRRQEAETLRRAGAAVAVASNQKEAIERILEELELVITYDTASVQLLRDGGYLEIVGGGGPSWPPSALGVRFAVPGNNPNTEVIQEIRPLLLDNVRLTNYSHFNREPYSYIHSWLGVPLVVQQRVIGMLTVDSTQVNHFSSDDVRQVTAFADQVAVALEKIRLLEIERVQTKQLMASRLQLETLSHRLLEAQETERRQIARDLHDEIGQTLTGLRMLLNLDLQSPADTLKNRLNESQAVVNEMIEKIDELLLDLRPPMLDDLGLLPTLVWHFERYTRQTGVQVRFTHRDLEQRRFSSQLEINAYRLIQEALTNVARHAKVDEAAVRVWINQELLHLEIEDQGAGFDLNQATSSTGLSGLRERVALLGGHLSIDSTPGDGTTLLAQLPVSKPTEHEENE